MNDLNMVALSCRLGKDPEKKVIPGRNISIVEASVCFNKSKKVDEKYEDIPQWIIAVFVKGNADTLTKYCKKGDRLIINGKLDVNSWEKDGVKHSQVKIFVNTFQFISKNGAVKEENIQHVEEDDIPF